MKRFIILAVLALISVFTEVSAQNYSNNNKVFWIHGLNDQQCYWDVYRHSLIDNNYLGFDFNWYSQNNINTSASDLNCLINQQLDYGKKAIVFGHSAGGLVARKAASQNGKIRAIITAGTPNQGAKIASSIKSNTASSAAKKAVSKVKSSTATSFAAFSYTIPGIGATICSCLSLLTNIGGTIGECFIESEVKNLENSFSSKAAVNDMVPGSGFLNGIPTATVPIINLYGNENGNRLIRLAGTMYKRDLVNSPYNSTDISYDESLMPVYNTLKTTGNTLQAIHYVVGAAAALGAILSPNLWAASALNITAGALWTDTTRYIQYDVHNVWDDIIGASHYETRYQYHQFLWWKWTTSYSVKIYENSDGFIPNKSSKMDERKGPRTRNYEVPGVNHLEMNSHFRMRRILNDILNSSESTIYGKEFSPQYN